MDLMEVIPRIGMILIPFLFALSVHEWAHGWVANKLGDKTAEMMGRLTLNPLSHADMIGTFILPVLAIATGGPFFGWAKPVPVNDRNLKNPRKGMAIVAAAGPASNVILALISAIIFGLAVRYFETANYTKAVVDFSKTFLMINLSLAFFNLLPIHPLDGGKILAIFFSDKTNEKLEAMAPVFSIALLVLFMTGGLANVLFAPVIKTANWMLTTSLTVFGVS